VRPLLATGSVAHFLFGCRLSLIHAAVARLEELVAFRVLRDRLFMRTADVCWISTAGVRCMRTGGRGMVGRLGHYWRLATDLAALLLFGLSRSDSTIAAVVCCGKTCSNEFVISLLGVRRLGSCSSCSSRTVDCLTVEIALSPRPPHRYRCILICGANGDRKKHYSQELLARVFARGLFFDRHRIVMFAHALSAYENLYDR